MKPEFKKKQTGNNIFNLIERLYPICRSITGDGVRETLSIVSEIIPLTVHEVASGTKVFDWQIPPEWNIRDAWVKNSNGDKIVDFKVSNLHVLNYSIPVDKKVTLSELKKHLFTLPDYPDWIPYRTSYYNRTWGFCMAHNQYKNLGEDTYHVMVDSTIEPGSLTYGEFFIPGKTDDEVLISTHVCHPSLCNDNLSGITIAAFAARQLMKKDSHYSYRFLFVPGTIGSISWLSKNKDKVKNIKHGLVLTLLGDTTAYHYKKSRMGDAKIDRIVEHILQHVDQEFKLIDFCPYGYDERQYCSPGFNLPVGRFSRKPHGEFPEYHTSADNLDFVKKDKLVESLELLFSIFEVIENDKTYLNLQPYGEPQLGKRGLFSKIGGAGNSKDYQMALLWVLNLSDGLHSLLSIAERSGLPFRLILDAAQALIKADLLLEKTDKFNSFGK